MIDLAGKRVLVTGGTGFLGRAVCRVLRERGSVPYSFRSDDWDLRDVCATGNLFRYITAGPGEFYGRSPEIVIHLAAKCGGIGANMAAPAEFIYDNLMMGLNVIEATRKAGAKLVMVGSVCSYPEKTERHEIHESDLWSGYPEPTNAPYGIAKRTLGEVLKAYHKQYGMACAYVIPANLYGPGDNFDPETSHVIPAMIRKFCHAVDMGHDCISCWGTGKATRDFLYVDDAARAIVDAAQHYDGPEPINIGTECEISIEKLAIEIAKICGFRGSIRWDNTRPDGQPRRVLDTTRAACVLDFCPTVTLEEGLRKTVQWYLENREQHAKQGTAAVGS